MLIQQIFEMRGLCNYNWGGGAITGCFYDKTVISEENNGLDCYLLLKYCWRQRVVLPLSGPNH